MWQTLLNKGATIVMPWLGGRQIYSSTGRRWTIEGRLPPEHGWYTFVERGRKVSVSGPADPDTDSLVDKTKGYLVGDRLVPDHTRVELSVEVLSRFEKIHLVETGLSRFSRIVAARAFKTGPLIYVEEDFPLGPEEAVLEAFQDNTSIDTIPGVVPALDAAFRFELHQRAEAERRRQEAAERRRQEEEARRLEELRAQVRERHGAENIRAIAEVDFTEAARAALAVGGAEYLDHRETQRGEYAVVFRVDGRRFECVCDRRLRIIDAGICLTDEVTGVKGDTWFSLESFPSVIMEAVRDGKLVVWRHV